MKCALNRDGESATFLSRICGKFQVSGRDILTSGDMRKGAYQYDSVQPDVAFSC